MLTPDQDKEYAELREDAREYLKYKKWHKRINRYGRDLVILFAIIFAVDFYPFRTGIAPYFLIALFVTAITLLLSDSILENLTERHSPTADRLATLFACATIDNLDHYFDPKKADTPQRKIIFRRKAIENGNALLSVIEENWVIGKFSLAETVFGKSISDFRELLSKRLIPTVKEGDPETYLKRTNEILWQFSVFLHSPSIGSLNRISKHIKDELPEITIHKGDYSNKFLTFLRSHILLTHALSILGIIGSTLLVYFAGVNNIGISPESAYNTSAQFLGIMVVGYLTITITIMIRRKER